LRGNKGIWDYFGAFPDVKEGTLDYYSVNNLNDVKTGEGIKYWSDRTREQ